MLPASNQARKAIWTAVDSLAQIKRIDWAFPLELRESTNDQEMLIRFKNGSTWQVAGSDNYQGIIGSGPYGIVYSEYMLSDPNSRLFLDPILQENGGWAIFNGVPRGRNHFYNLFELGRSEPGWFSELLTVKDTGVFTLEQLEKIRRELARERGDDEAENIINQEYYCSWDAAIPGSYYGKLIAKAEAEGRITDVPHDPRLQVLTGWDLGVGDSTAIWFVQQTKFGVNVIDYYENSGVGADHYARVLKERGYTYEGHYLPHDADDREWGNNASSRIETLKSLGVKPARVLPRSSVDDGINAVRVLLPRCNFDAKKCERGLDCLRQYQKRWDDKLKNFANAPLHDWTSHGCFLGTTIVWTRSGMRQIMDLPPSGEVLTSCGWKAYVNPRVTKRSAPLVEVVFESGYTVRCTPDHLFKTVSGWKSAVSLQKGTVIQSGWTCSPGTSMVGSIELGPASDTPLGVDTSSIAMHGKGLLGRFRRIATFITGMRIASTTRSRILNVLMPRSIYAVPGSRALFISLTMLVSEPPLGTAPRPGGYGISDTRRVPRAGINGSALIKHVNGVVKFLTRWFEQRYRNGSAAITAKPLTIASVERLDYRSDVWDLTVPDVHEFALGNGAIVHNSDAMRTLAQGLKNPQTGHPQGGRPRYAIT